MVDANQAWSPEHAARMAQSLAPYHLHWLEEPITADQPVSAWQILAKASSTPLAAGENLMGQAHFESMIDSGALRFVQPDSAKWGGISGVLPVIEATQRRGAIYCPHYLGGGIGHMASAHLMAAMGQSDSMLEVDSNANPLRSEFAPAFQHLSDGWVSLGEAPGIGFEPPPSLIDRFRVDHESAG